MSINGKCLPFTFPPSREVIDLEEVVAYIVKEAKKDEIGEYDPEEVLFVVQGEMEYGNSLGQVD